MDIRKLLEERLHEEYVLSEKYMNHQMVRVLKTIGFDRYWVKAEGPYLFDKQGERYLDLLAGFGVFALGRNHPKVIQTLHDVLDAELPNMIQMDVSPLAGLLAERLLEIMPDGLERVFFANSGTETCEAALKFARAATGRSRIVYCEGAFHGLTLGSLSTSGDEHFREGFGDLLPGCEQIPFGDLDALERALSGNDVAAFITEPIQGHGVFIPPNDYFPQAIELCRKYGSLFISDEVQTGLGRTGKMWAMEHWGVEPDMLCVAKALSGGFVPVGAVACRKWIFEKVFNRMDRAMVHSNTFGRNNLAMAAGLVTLEVLQEEKIVENSAQQGEEILAALTPLVEEYECLSEVRGRGLMLALEFAEPESWKLKVSWKMLESANKGLFSQMIVVPLFTRHKLLSQVAGHEMNIIKFIPPLIINDEDRHWIVDAVKDVVADAHRVPGAVWDFGKMLATQALKMKAGSR